MNCAALSYSPSLEVQAIGDAEHRVKELEQRAAEYADEPDTLAAINEALAHARSRLERLAAPWKKP
ncbi:hypothetical protein [Xanthomonas sp. SI]|uniref:hypothetical protein n=1 Tax=Xanthomonas sp. SI TaxID=2724123 RepID=UPI00163A675A|nr:hypothetical protein [Xanthomonas sp. SI]QNH11203.1 hypothetical protein HEP75_00621 [Xanthomonas sp. SI]